MSEFRQISRPATTAARMSTKASCGPQKIYAMGMRHVVM
jgi:hypothetical protein